MERYNKVLLLTDVPSFAQRYKAIASSVDVSMESEPVWNPKFRVVEDLIIFGSKYLDRVNEKFYFKSVIILKEGENPFDYTERGIQRFIFNFYNDFELLYTLFKEKQKIIRTIDTKLDDIIADSEYSQFSFGDYDFRFDTNLYKYRGQRIYLRESEKLYLANWLLKGTKENKKRSILFTLRKKFGTNFLRDVNRFGQIEE